MDGFDKRDFLQSIFDDIHNREKKQYHWEPVCALGDDWIKRKEKNNRAADKLKNALDKLTAERDLFWAELHELTGTEGSVIKIEDGTLFVKKEGKQGELEDEDKA